jgi:hypothetical protein
MTLTHDLVQGNYNNRTQAAKFCWVPSLVCGATSPVLSLWSTASVVLWMYTRFFMRPKRKLRDVSLNESGGQGSSSRRQSHPSCGSGRQAPRGTTVTVQCPDEHFLAEGKTSFLSVTFNFTPGISCMIHPFELVATLGAFLKLFKT